MGEGDSSSNEGPHLYPRGDDNELANIHWRILKIFSGTDGSNSTKFGTSLGYLYDDYSLLKWRVAPFSREDNKEIAQILWQNFKILLSRTDGPVSTTPCERHLWVMVIKVSNEGSRPFPRGDNNEIFVAKIHWRKFKNLCQTWHKASLDYGNSILSKWSGKPCSKGRYKLNSETILTNFTIKSSPPKRLSQFQPNLILSIFWWRGFNKFVEMKSNALFQRDEIMKWQKYIEGSLGLQWMSPEEIWRFSIFSTPSMYISFNDVSV